MSSQCNSGSSQNLAYDFSNFCRHKLCYFTTNSVDFNGRCLVVGGLRGVRFVFYLLIFTVMLFYRVCCRFKQIQAQVLLTLHCYDEEHVLVIWTSSPIFVRYCSALGIFKILKENSKWLPWSDQHLCTYRKYSPLLNCKRWGSISYGDMYDILLSFMDWERVVFTSFSCTNQLIRKCFFQKLEFYTQTRAHARTHTRTHGRTYTHYPYSLQLARGE